MQKECSDKYNLIITVVGKCYCAPIDNFLKHCDLGVESMYWHDSYTLKLNTSAELNDKYVKKLMKKLGEFHEKSEYGKMGSLPVYFEIEDYSYKII